MSLLADDPIEGFVAEHPDWTWADDSIARTFEFSDFVGAMGFVTRVALEAEKVNHHPDIDIRWNRVTLTLSTHSEGGLTQNDLDLADTVDGLA